MKNRKRIFLVLFTILLCIGCDQFTKDIARLHLPKHKALSFADDMLRLDYNENKGAVLTFEWHLPAKWQGTRFTIVVAILLALIVFCLLFTSVLGPLTVAALSLISGGVASNLLDRVVLGGNVVDFLNIGWGGFRTGIFNIADVAISIGVFLLALSLLRRLLSPLFKGRAEHSH